MKNKSLHRNADFCLLKIFHALPQNAQEGRFPRTVGTDDAVAVAGQELQVNVLEQPLTAELHTEIRDSNHFILLILAFIGKLFAEHIILHDNHTIK